MVEKAQAFIIRKKVTTELLVFQHDITKLFQVVRGTVEAGELPEETILREIEEESGLLSCRIIKKIGEVELQIPGGPTRTGPLESQLHHAYLIECLKDTPEKWTHNVSGSEVENGLKFHFSWYPIDQKLLDLIKVTEMQYFIKFLLDQHV